MKGIIPDVMKLISKCLGGIYSLASVFAMYTNEQRQCIHDMVAGTVVIHDSGKISPPAAGSDDMPPATSEDSPFTIR